MAKSIQEMAREFSLGFLSKEEQDASFRAFCEGYRLGFKDKVQRDDWDLSFALNSFQPILYEWICYRKEIKKSFKSIKSVQAAYKQLYELSDGNPSIAMKIVEQSIASSWQGLFPLKQNDNNRNNFGKPRENGDSESLFSIANQLLQDYQ
jgi:hypothetical protein